MTVKKISDNVVYSVEMTQTQLDKVYAILASVNDEDTDKLFLEMGDHYVDSAFMLKDYDGCDLCDLEVSK